MGRGRETFYDFCDGKQRLDQTRCLPQPLGDKLFRVCNLICQVIFREEEFLFEDDESESWVRKRHKERIR